MWPVVKGLADTRRQILLFVILMLPASLLLFGTGVVSWLYLSMAILLGGAWLYKAIAGWSSRMTKIGPEGCSSFRFCT